MAKYQHQASVLARWLSAGHTQISLSKSARVNQPALSRAFAGESRFEPETLGKILAVIAPQEPIIAADLLEAYLLDGLPEGAAPDGESWLDHVKIIVRDLIPPNNRIAEENRPVDELEEALAYINKSARTNMHARAIVVGFYRIRHPRK